jgi:hypothetical protein
VSGPDGRGYITQPFSPPLAQDYMPYSAYSPRYRYLPLLKRIFFYQLGTGK